MAVDSHHLFSNREIMMNNNNNNNTIMQPSSGGFNYALTDVMPPNIHMYGASAFTADTITPTTVDSSAYYVDSSNGFIPLQTRKRSRDSRFNDCYNHLSHHSPRSSSCVTTTTITPFSFLGHDMDIHINQQQQDLDRFVYLHMERVKFEMEEKRKRQARTIMESIGNGLAKRLRVKEEERDRVGKINHALEERVKSLSVENQIWRDLAQANEATANNLRTNLEQVLAQVKDLRNVPAGLHNGCDNDDAQSCCGSSTGQETAAVRGGGGGGGSTSSSRKCRNCGEGESCVLLLPCRHLCLCGVCGSSMHTCPICKSPKNASVHVNMSSS